MTVLVHIAALETTVDTIRDAYQIFQIIGKLLEQSNNFVQKQDLISKN